MTGELLSDTMSFAPGLTISGGQAFGLTSTNNGFQAFDGILG